MKAVTREEIIDYVTYEEGRDKFRDKVLEAKIPRRLHVGEYLTLLFENHLTVQYQIQEMIRAERIVKEADICHEIDTYNELLGTNGELGCTLLIEIDDPQIRNVKLREWWHLPEKIYVRLEDDRRVWATFDQRQRGEDRVSSVQFLKFNTQGQIPTAVGVDLPELITETNLTNEQRAALKEDLV